MLVAADGVPLSHRTGLFSPLYWTDQTPVDVWISVWLPSSSNCGMNSSRRDAESQRLEIRVYWLRLLAV